jgi:mono/diheme cytochrome c family protein
MWNHASEMLDQSWRHGKSWPRLSGQDTRDLLSYLWRLPKPVPAGTFRFGDDAEGRNVFNERCATCHTLGRKEAGRVDLNGTLYRTTMSQLAAAMWNHAPAMKQKNPATSLPRLSEADIRNLVTYLVVGRAFEETGNPRFGESVYRSGTCGYCHESGINPFNAPALRDLKGPFDAVRMTSVLWSHGPRMLDALKQENLKWPRFDTRDMLDLIAYLNERAGK